MIVGEILVGVLVGPVVVGLEAEIPPDHPSSAPEVLEQALANIDPVLSASGRCLDVCWREVDRSIARTSIGQVTIVGDVLGDSLPIRASREPRC